MHCLIAPSLALKFILVWWWKDASLLGFASICSVNPCSYVIEPTMTPTTAVCFVRQLNYSPECTSSRTSASSSVGALSFLAATVRFVVSPGFPMLSMPQVAESQSTCARMRSEVAPSSALLFLFCWRHISIVAATLSILYDSHSHGFLYVILPNRSGGQQPKTHTHQYSLYSTRSSFLAQMNAFPNWT